MKLKTFKDIFIIAVSLYSLSFIFMEDKLLPFIFPSDTPVWLEFFPLKNSAIIIFSVSVIIYFLKSTFSINKESRMTPRAYSLSAVIFTLVIVFPFIFYPSRTQITTEAITLHSLTGKVSEVYLIEDAQKVTVRLNAYGDGGGRRTMPKTHLNFSYEIEFKNGKTYTLEDTDDEIWWTIVDGIDSVITASNIKKEIQGKALDEIIYEFSDAYNVINHRDKILEIMNR